MPIDELKVYFITGQEMCAHEIDGNEDIELDASYWPSGVYFIWMKISKKLVVRKVIKR